MKRHTAEEIIPKLRQAEADLAQGLTIAQVCQTPRRQRADPAPLAQPVRRPQGRRGQAPQGTGGRERPPQAPRRRAGPGQADAPGGRAKKVVTAQRRRQAVRHLQERFGVSAASRLPRAGAAPLDAAADAEDATEEEGRLVGRMLELVRQHPRFGYRRIWALLRREGWRVNRKRVHRLWRKQGLKVPRKQRKKRRLGSAAPTVACVGRRNTRTMSGRGTSCTTGRATAGPLKWFTLVDEYTRECLALEVERGMTARAVGDGAGRAWCASAGRRCTSAGQRAGVHRQGDPGVDGGAGPGDAVHRAGAPWENGYAESFNSKVRDELLNAEEFGSVLEAQGAGEGVAAGLQPCPTSQLAGVSDAGGVRGDVFLGPTPLRCAGPRTHL